MAPDIIAGLDDANIKDVYPYVGTARKAWYEIALVVIRSAKKRSQ